MLVVGLSQSLFCVNDGKKVGHTSLCFCSYMIYNMKYRIISERKLLIAALIFPNISYYILTYLIMSLIILSC